LLRHVTLEDGREGRPVCDIEEAQGANRHVQIAGVDISPEGAFALPALNAAARVE
jgi:hypothetical protein